MTDMIEPKSRPGPQADDTNAAPAARKLSGIFFNAAAGLGVLTVGLAAAGVAGLGVCGIAETAGNYQLYRSVNPLILYAFNSCLITGPFAVAAAIAGCMCKDAATGQQAAKDNQTPPPSPRPK